MKEQSIERILGFLDHKTKLEFRIACKVANKLVSIRGGWSEAIMSLFLPDFDMPEHYEALASGKNISNSPFALGRHPLSSIKNKNNRLWFSYFKTVSHLAGPAPFGTDIDALLQELSRSLLHQFKSSSG